MPRGSIVVTSIGYAAVHAQNLKTATAPPAAALFRRTPWGNPDLQGTYTNTYENGTPFLSARPRAGADRN